MSPTPTPATLPVDWLRATDLADAMAVLDGDTVTAIVTEASDDPARLRGLLLAYLGVSRPAASSVLADVRARVTAQAYTAAMG